MKRRLIVCFSLITLLVLILDPTTTQQGASEGIMLCIQTVIPALFPFLVLSSILTNALQGNQSRILRRIGKILRIPDGYESIWLIGLLGGYPIGAKCITDAVSIDGLSHLDAERMLCFCSNAGPAFIFGLGIHLFGDLRYAFLVWGIHIFSSAVVAFLTPGFPHLVAVKQAQRNVNVSLAVNKAVQTMAMICGWVVLFRILITVIHQRILFLLGDEMIPIFSGMLELTNGCSMLQNYSTFSTRLVLMSGFLGFGGFCVAMQTHTILSNAGVSFTPYLPAKFTQAAISAIVSSVVAMICFPEEKVVRLSWVLISGLVILSYKLVYHQKSSEKVLSFPGKMMYTNSKLHTR